MNGIAYRDPTIRNGPRSAWLSVPFMRKATQQTVPHVWGTHGPLSDVAAAREGRLGSDPPTLLRMLPFTSRFAPPALLSNHEQRRVAHGIRGDVVASVGGGLTIG